MPARSAVPSRCLRCASALLLSVTLSLSAAAQSVPWQTKIEASPYAQTLPQDRGADGLAQTLRKLDTWGSLLFIVAHPDDEDGGMLTYESRGQGIRTALLTLNRGEGGQNAMSGEADDALGLMRTNELLLADRYSGSGQYFSSVVDFGFSKTIQEAHQKWGRQRVLCDVVRVVRMYRPLVLASTFTGNITDGHGQHQVSGEMNQEAYLQAGNPAVCPDQIAAGLRPWTPLRVYARVPFFGAGSKGIFDYATNKWSPVRFYDYVTKQWVNQFPPATLHIPEGTWDPILGESYFQMARTGWGLQKSQYGGATIPLPGPVSVGYHLYGSRVSGADQGGSFFQGIDTSLAGLASLARSNNKQFLVAGLNAIQQQVTFAIDHNDPAQPEKIAPALAGGYKATQQLITQVNASSLSADDKTNVNHELNIKLAQFNTALAEALGLEVNALVMPSSAADKSGSLPLSPEETSTTVTPGSAINVRLHVTAQSFWGASPGGLHLTRTWLDNPNGDHWQVSRIGKPASTPTSVADDLFRVQVPHDAQLTRPYFTRHNTEQPFYNITDPRWRNLPFAPYPLAGWAEFSYMGVPIRIGQIVQTVHRVHGIGGLYQPLAVVPQISVNLPGSAGVAPLETTSIPFPVTISNPQQRLADGTLHLDLPTGWTSDPPQLTFHLAAGASSNEHFTLHPSRLTPQNYEIRAIAQSGGDQFTQGFTTVGYEGLPPYYLYSPSSYRLRALRIKVPAGLRIGYVMGTGDEVPADLAEIGIHPQLLTAAQLASGDLSRYDAIVIGIRAYSARPDLIAATSRLFDYVHKGGVVLVQYQRDQFPAPYPITLGDNPEKVVDETAPVSLLAPDNPLLTWPNRITPADFDGWIEERGHSFLNSWPSEYTALTEVHDPGEDPQKGGLIYTRYGRGIWIYMAYAVYRQLPEAVPGAYRLLDNLLAAARNPALR